MFRRVVGAALVVTISISTGIAMPAQQQGSPDDSNAPRKPFQGVANNPRLQQPSAQPKAPYSLFLPYQPPSPPKTAQQLEAAKRLGASLPYLVAQSDAGDGAASYLAGRAYEVGLGTPGGRPDLQKAIHYYTLASKRGILNGQYHEGYLMTRGFYDDVIAQPGYVRSQGEYRMRNAITGGYNVRSEDIQREQNRHSASAPSSTPDTVKAALVIGALVVAAAILGGGNNTSTFNTNQNPTYPQPRYCMVPDTVRSADGTVLWQGSRAGYGGECP